MPTAALAELHLDTDRRHACETLTDRATELGRFELLLGEGVRIVRWAPGITALRLTGRWHSGRAQGEVTVDLLATGSGRTLLSVGLEQPARLARRVTEDDAWSVASHLRELVERRSHRTSPAATISGLSAARSGILPA